MTRLRSKGYVAVAAAATLATVCGVAVVASGDAATVPPKCWGYHQPPCYYDVRIEASYSNGEFVMGTFRGTVSARMTATFRRVPLQTIWRRGTPNVWIGIGKLVSGRVPPATTAVGTLRATVSADVRSLVAGTAPCTIRGSYLRRTRLELTGFRGVGVNRGTFSVRSVPARPISARCGNSPVYLRHVVSGLRPFTASHGFHVSGLSFGYEQTIVSAQEPVPGWDRLFSGRNFGFSRTFTGPAEPPFADGSFGFSQSAAVRVSFKRVG